MKFLNLFLVLALAGTVSLSAQENDVLVFHKTAGFYHSSIPKGIATVEELGKKHDFNVTATDDSSEFTSEKLQNYDLVIFLSTTGDVLNETQERDFEKYMKNGGNYFGVHAAADTEYDWPWYGDLVGAYFMSHPQVQEANVEIENPEHSTVAHLPETWKRTDEWYNYKNINPENRILMSLDENSYEGGENGENHPIAWFKDLPGGGKAIYTGGGHTDAAFDEPLFREHLLQSIFFALDRN